MNNAVIRIITETPQVEHPARHGQDQHTDDAQHADRERHVAIGADALEQRVQLGRHVDASVKS
jgi:hypothetical protein